MKLFTGINRVRQLVLTAAAAFVSVAANAQFSQTVQQYPTTDYSSVTAEFKLTDVAQAVGTDAATLAAALDEWHNAIAPEEGEPTPPEGTPMFQVKGSAGTLAPADNNSWTGNAGEMWMDAEGNAANYGETAKIFGGINWDTENDAFTVFTGQMPEAFVGGEQAKFTAVLNYNGKQATFDITFNILVLPDAPEPKTVKRSELSTMTMVGEKSIDVERYTHQGYDATPVSFDLSDLGTLFGADNAAIAPVLSKIMYTNWYDTELGVMRDSLTNESTAGAPGWWLRRTMYGQGHEQQGEPSDYVAAAAYGADCSIFLEAFTLNPATGELTCNLGQYPGTNKADELSKAEFYIIYGDKYYKLNVNVKFVEAESKGLDELVSLGNLDVNVTIDDTFADYQTTRVNVDAEAVATALGVELSGLAPKMQKDENSLYSGTGTANNGGYWFDENGFVTSWGATAAFFWEPVTTDDYSVLNVGAYAGKQANVGTTCNAKIYFLNPEGDKYYTVTLNIEVVHKETGSQDAWEVVDKKPAAVQVIASATDYIADGNQTHFTLTPAQCEEILGIAEPKLYIMNADSIPEQGGNKYAPYTQYLCSPAPGVWINADGRGHAWGADAPVGICWNTSTGVFDVYQYPGANEVGTVRNVSLFLVNEETEKMIEVAFTISFVADIAQAEKVGEENIKVPVVGFDQAQCEIDLEKAATALGVTIDDLMSTDNYYLKGMLASGLYSEATTPTNGLFFNLSGEYDEYGVISLSIKKDGEKYYIVTDLSEDIEAPFKTTGAMCFEVEGKQYVYNITFMDEESYTSGISEITTDGADNNRMYNIAGQQIKTAKGLYIMNGKKYIAK